MTQSISERERLRRLALVRCGQVLEQLCRNPSEDEKRRAALALGRRDLVANPQKELSLKGAA